MNNDCMSSSVFCCGATIACAGIAASAGGAHVQLNLAIVIISPQPGRGHVIWTNKGYTELVYYPSISPPVS